MKTILYNQKLPNLQILTPLKMKQCNTFGYRKREVGRETEADTQRKREGEERERVGDIQTQYK